MTDDTPTLQQAIEYHRNLPLRLYEYLNHRGILDEQIRAHLLGFDGERITIPIRDRTGGISQFRRAKDPNDAASAPKMLSSRGASAELYGWEWARMEPDRLMICEGEFDRIVLERFGFAAVTSTGGASVFKTTWAKALEEIPEIFVCLDRDAAGRRGTVKIGRCLPQAKLVRWPEEVGRGGDVTDYFIELGHSREDFLELLEEAETVPLPKRYEGRRKERRKEIEAKSSSADNEDRREIEKLKGKFRIERFIQRYLPLRPSGTNYRGRCPFHDDRTPSLVVYPETQSFYCFGCQVGGDVITFLQELEGLTFPEALETLRNLAPGS